MINTDQKICYVYAILVDGIVRYIGKGSKNRVRVHKATAIRILKSRRAGKKIRTQKLYNRLAKAISNKSIISHQIIVCGLSDQEAFDREVQEISLYPKSQLWNSDGGGKGTFRFTLALKRKMKKSARRSWDTGNRRNRHIETHSSEEYSKKMSAIMKAQRSQKKYKPRSFTDEQRELAKDFANKGWANNPDRRFASGRIFSNLWSDPSFVEKHKLGQQKRRERNRLVEEEILNEFIANNDIEEIDY